MCYRVEVEVDYTDGPNPKLTIKVPEFLLFYGAWKWIPRCSASVFLPRALGRIGSNVVLTGGKNVYMLARAGYSGWMLTRDRRPGESLHHQVPGRCHIQQSEPHTLQE